MPVVELATALPGTKVVFLTTVDLHATVERWLNLGLFTGVLFHKGSFVRHRLTPIQVLNRTADYFASRFRRGEDLITN